MRARASFLLLAVLSAASLARGQSPPSLDALLAGFRAVPGLVAHFREEKHIALLAAPLVTEGTLHYAPPSRLARHATSPARSSLVLDGDLLAMGDAAHVERLDLRARPGIAGFVAAFRAVLSGDRATLERSFRATLSGDPAADWQLVLVPRGPPIARYVARVVLTGSDVHVATMRVLETNGDESVTTFSAVDVAHRYAPAEAARVFRVPGP